MLLLLFLFLITNPNLFLSFFSFVCNLLCPLPSVGKNCAYKISKPSYFRVDLPQLLSLNSPGQPGPPGPAGPGDFTTLRCCHLKLRETSQNNWCRNVVLKLFSTLVFVLFWLLQGKKRSRLRTPPLEKTIFEQHIVFGGLPNFNKWNTLLCFYLYSS